MREIEDILRSTTVAPTEGLWINDGELLLMDKAKLTNVIPILAQKHGFKPDLIEKDYYLTIMLNSIGSHFGDSIVFKGGTLLNKVHLNYHRLSEDLDFTYFSGHGLNSRSQRSKAMTPIREKMPEFLNHVGLRSDKPKGEGFNNSTQYVFDISYDSFVTGKDEHVKLEVSLRQPPLDKPVHNVIKHFYQDPYSGVDMVPAHKVLSLSFKEAVAEKLKAAITRKDAAIRDYFDLWHISQAKFDFHDPHFVSLFKKKLADEGHSKKEYKYNFGLSEETVKLLRAQIEPDLIPVIRAGEQFDLDKVFGLFNRMLADV
jgi:predicted nucleotidyltransferase component of viral defense system